MNLRNSRCIAAVVFVVMGEQKFVDWRFGDPLTDDEKPKLDKCISILKKARVDWFVTFACCLGGDFPEIPLTLVYEFSGVSSLVAEDESEEEYWSEEDN